MVQLGLAMGTTSDDGKNAAPTRANRVANRVAPEDRAAHEWYRFVLSFPPHLVRDYAARFDLTENHLLLDPFCGTGTTLVEGKRLGVPSVGLEPNPMAHFASRVKTDWTPESDSLAAHACLVAETASLKLAGLPAEPFLCLEARAPYLLRTLPPEALSLLLTNCISPLPLHKTLILLECIEELRDDRFYAHERLALARALVSTIGNLHFGPEVGVGPPKPDAPVVASWLANVQTMADDLRGLGKRAPVKVTVHLTDARSFGKRLLPESVDAVITSPPYPNEKDYTRTTRLESVLLGFLNNRQELRALKTDLVRSNTRGVYKADSDDEWIAGHARIQQIADEIEERRIALGKTSGFERLYARVTKLYFGGMARHLSELRPVLKPGAMLAYVVGDQASYLRVMIRTGQLLAEIAVSLGYELVSIDLFRTRIATATREQLREEVVVLRWPGGELRSARTKLVCSDYRTNIRYAPPRR